MATLARSVWKKREGEVAPWCTRCEAPINQCKFLGTSKQDSCCLLSLQLDREDLKTLQKLGGPVIMLED